MISTMTSHIHLYKEMEEEQVGAGTKNTSILHKEKNNKKLYIKVNKSLNTEATF